MGRKLFDKRSSRAPIPISDRGFEMFLVGREKEWGLPADAAHIFMHVLFF
jgi:hypothetical protein